MADDQFETDLSNERVMQAIAERIRARRPTPKVAPTILSPRESMKNLANAIIALGDTLPYGWEASISSVGGLKLGKKRFSLENPTPKEMRQLVAIAEEIAEQVSPDSPKRQQLESATNAVFRLTVNQGRKIEY